MKPRASTAGELISLSTITFDLPLPTCQTGFDHFNSLASARGVVAMLIGLLTFQPLVSILLVNEDIACYQATLVPE